MYFIRCLGCSKQESFFTFKFVHMVKGFIDMHKDCEIDGFEVGVKISTLVKRESDIDKLPEVLKKISEKYI